MTDSVMVEKDMDRFFIIGCNVVCGFTRKLAQSTIGIVGIGRVFLCAKVADSYVLGVVGVGMTTSRNESICGVVGKALNTVVQHIAVHIVRYGIAVKYNQSVVCVVNKATLRRIGNITGSIVGKGLLGKNVAAQILGRSLGHTAEIIISTTYFGRICKCLYKNYRPIPGGRKIYIFSLWHKILLVVPVAIFF